MKVYELMERYNPDVLVDVMRGDNNISTSTAPNIIEFYGGATVDRFEVVHLTSGEGRLTVHLMDVKEV